MAEIVIDPRVPAPARRQLEQAALSTLVGFGDPLPGEARAGRSRAAPSGARVAGSAVLGVVLGLMSAGLSSPGPFAADLVFLALLIALPCAVAGTLYLTRPGRDRSGQRGWLWARQSAAVAYHRRYVVPELDLHGDSLARWRRASRAARQIRQSEAVRLGLIDSVEVAAVLPYHLWDVAERLALLSAPDRRQARIMRNLDPADPDVREVFEPQRQVRDLTLADIERRIDLLEEFATLSATADAARKRQRSIAELAELNPDYEELLARLEDAGFALATTDRLGDQLRAVAAAADDAVRRANDAGRSLAIPEQPSDLAAPGAGAGPRRVHPTGC